MATPVFAVDPTVTNVQAAQKVGTKQVEIYYDMSGSTSPVFVSLQVSSNGGTSFAVPVAALSGDVGANIALGRSKKITWNAGVDWNNQLSNTVKFRVTASIFAPIGDMVLIPGGTFQMGNSFTGEGSSDEVPVHSVTVNAFYLQSVEVTKAQWDTVRIWGAASDRGYTDLLEGGGKAANHPVHSISWYTVVKWCNARSQMENLTPCYTVGGVTYKTGSSAPDCNWSASGYRLPSEAEWERAARGGLSGRRFPWGDTIMHSLANYTSSSSYAYDVSPTRGPHPTYEFNDPPFTSPVGSFEPYGYGLYDITGNLWEWCWDRYSSVYYSSSPLSNPRGHTSNSFRVVRGGRWANYADNCRTASRLEYDPGRSLLSVGFRPARSSVP